MTIRWIVCLGAIFVWCQLGLCEDRFREWTGRNGEIRVAAELVSVSQCDASFRRPDGSVFTARIENLCDGDQVLLRRVLERSTDQIGERSANGTKSLVVEPRSDLNAQPRRWFIAIGVDDYRNNGEISNLHFCSNDVKHLATAFSNLGYEEVVCLSSNEQDATLRPTSANVQKQIDLALGVYDDRGTLVVPGLVGPGDVVVIAFSGHGTYIQDKGYLCLEDADLHSPESSMMSVSAIFQQLSRCPARLRVLLVDACRNELAAQRAIPDTGVERGGQLKQLAREFSTTRAGIITISSCAVGQTSTEDPNLKQGVFSYFLTKGLLGAAAKRAAQDKYEINLTKLFDYTASCVEAYAREHGRIQEPRLTAMELQNACLGILNELDVPPAENVAVPSGPPPTEYKLDLSQVADGQLPSGWTGSQIGVSRTLKAPALLAMQDSAQWIESPPLAIQGDFYMQFDVLPTGSKPSFEVILLGDDGVAEYPLQFTGRLTGHTGWDVIMNQSNGKKLPAQDYIPYTFRLERRNGVSQLFCNSDSSNVVTARDETISRYNAVRIQMNDRQVRLIGMKLGALHSEKPLEGDATQPYSARLNASGELSGWNLPVAVQHDHARLESPPLRIVDDFVMTARVHMSPYNRAFAYGITLLGDGGGRDFPIRIFGQNGFDVSSSLPGASTRKAKIARDAGHLIQVERVANVFRLLINEQEVGQLRASGFGDFCGIRFDTKTASSLRFESVSVR